MSEHLVVTLVGALVLAAAWWKTKRNVPVVNSAVKNQFMDCDNLIRNSWIVTATARNWQSKHLQHCGICMIQGSSKTFRSYCRPKSLPGWSRYHMSHGDLLINTQGLEDLSKVHHHDEVDIGNFRLPVTGLHPSVPPWFSTPSSAQSVARSPHLILIRDWTKFLRWFPLKWFREPNLQTLGIWMYDRYCFIGVRSLLEWILLHVSFDGKRNRFVRGLYASLGCCFCVGEYSTRILVARLSVFFPAFLTQKRLHCFCKCGNSCCSCFQKQGPWCARRAKFCSLSWFLPNHAGIHRLAGRPPVKARASVVSRLQIVQFFRHLF